MTQNTAVPLRGHREAARVWSRVAFTLCAGWIAQACTVGNDVPQLPDVRVEYDAGILSDSAMPDVFLFPDATVDRCVSAGSTLGETCSTDGECNDGCFCNGTETCSGSVCTAGSDPCTDEIDCTAEACLEETNQCFFEPRHAMCSNDDACDGVELCSTDLGCVEDTPPYCNDEDACTVDSCEADVGCTFVVRDLDGDGFTDGRCGGEDCDDDPRYGRDIYPTAPEQCSNRRDDNCNGQRDYFDPSCVPMNDTCATAEELPGPGTYSASTSRLTSNFTLSCGSSGPDAVFKFRLTETKDVRVGIVGVSGAASVAIRPFDMCAAGPDERCNASSPPTLLRRSLPPGEWAIIVRAPSTAPFDLSLMFLPPTPIPANDVCNAMTQDVSAGGTFTGNWIESENDYTLSCHGGSYRDAAFRFLLTEPRDVELTASSTGPSGTPVTYLSLTSDCSMPASSLVCVQGSSASTRRREMPPGTYYVLLEPAADTSLTWRLDVSITAPAPRNPGDACSSAIDVTPAADDTPRSGMASLSMMEFDYGTSCGGSTAVYRDAVFRFELTETKDVELRTEGMGVHFIGTGTTCGVQASEIRCRTGSSPYAQRWQSLAPGTYYVIGSTTSSVGTAVATVTYRAPTVAPPNDRCSGAVDISAGGLRNDTLIDFEDDVVGAASGLPDSFYTFTLTERQIVLLSATRAVGSTGLVYLTLRSVCGAGTNVASASGNPNAVIDTVLDPGTYFLIVEEPAALTSDYRLSTAFFDP